MSEHNRALELTANIIEAIAGSLRQEFLKNAPPEDHLTDLAHFVRGLRQGQLVPLRVRHLIEDIVQNELDGKWEPLGKAAQRVVDRIDPNKGDV